MKNLLTILLILISLNSFANKIYISGGGGGYAGDDFAHPGDTVVFRSSDNNRTYFSSSYLRGTPQQPIVLINEGGQVIFTLGMNLKNWHYVKITGTGDAGTFYGFKVIGNTGGVAIDIEGRSENIELDHVDVYNCTYGVWAKQDPGCVDSINYPNWIMDSIIIHDCRFKKIGQDVIYAGNTSPNGNTFNCGAGNVTKYPMRLSNFYFYNNSIDSANRTGVQVSECMGGKVYNNTISNMGYEYNQSQGTGISIGGHTYQLTVTGNTINRTFLYGIVNFGKGKNNIYGNTVDSSGVLYIDPSVNIDSLCKKLDTALHAVNSAWNVGTKTIRYSGRYMFNNYSQPCNIFMRPDNDLLQYPALDSSTWVCANNKVGYSIVVDGSWNIIGGNANKIVVTDLSHNPFGKNNFIVNNTLIGNSTAANVSVYSGFFYNNDLLHMTRQPTIQYTGRLTFTIRH